MSREEEESSCAEEVHPQQREPTAQGVRWGRAWRVLRTGRIQARGGGGGQVK